MSLLMRSVICPVHTEKMRTRYFVSERLEKQDEKVKATNNLTIKNVGYELNTVTASDAQGNLTSDPNTVTHTSNGIWTKNY